MIVILVPGWRYSRDKGRFEPAFKAWCLVMMREMPSSLPHPFFERGSHGACGSLEFTMYPEMTSTSSSCCPLLRVSIISLRHGHDFLLLSICSSTPSPFLFSSSSSSSASSSPNRYWIIRDLMPYNEPTVEAQFHPRLVWLCSLCPAKYKDAHYITVTIKKTWEQTRVPTGKATDNIGSIWKISSVKGSGLFLLV